MIQRVYERCRGVFGEPCYVATDDSRIERAVTAFGGKAIMTSTAHRSGTDRCAEALDTAERLTGERFDVVVNIQGDEPFITREMFVKLLEPFQSSRCESATLGVILDEEKDRERIFSPNQVKIALAQNGEALYFSRSPIPFARDAVRKAPYVGHVGVYAFRRITLEKMAEFPPSPLEETEKLEQLRLLEHGIRMQVRLISEAPHGVDTPEDLEKALEYYNNHPEYWIKSK